MILFVWMNRGVIILNEKNTKKLLKDFPSLYKRENLMFGIETDNGWFDLIYKLSQDLMKVCPECEASQAKEKFGSLRYYVDNCNEEGHKLIDEAEEKSATICELCGKSGKLREDLGWVKTLCLEHYDIFRDPLKYRDFRNSTGL
jgi:predicted nucleic acid-binding Zn ribbon protein